MTEPADPVVELPTSDCTVCSHPEAAAIDAGLLSGTPLRTLVETHGPSRSALHRHKQNHLTLQTITEQEDQPARPPLRLIDVHGQLTSLTDRLEKAVELASRTRKAPAAVAAMRELRQTLEVIARLQADPDLKRAAALDSLMRELDEMAAGPMVAMFDGIITAFGLARKVGDAGPILGALMASSLRSLAVNGVDGRFADVDYEPARQYVERQAVERAERIEVEVERRVAVRLEEELRRREAQIRPPTPIEARQQHAIEGRGPSWS